MSVTTGLPEYFWALVDRSGGPTSCWNWIGQKCRGDGSGYVSLPTRQEAAHRVAYKLDHGPIPFGLSIIHTCRNKACCNPAHLRAVTHAELARVRVPASQNR